MAKKNRKANAAAAAGENEAGEQEAVIANAAPETTEQEATATEVVEQETVAVEILFVRTRQGVKRFRRAGFDFGETGIGLERAMLTDEQIAALKNEPMLIVEEGSVDAADEAE